MTSSKALEYGLGPIPAAVLGVTTAVGGGVLRDTVAREIPALVSPHAELYAVPALVGAVMVVLGRRLDYHESAIAVGAAVFVFIFRVVALARGWHAPQAWHRFER